MAPGSSMAPFGRKIHASIHSGKFNITCIMSTQTIQPCGLMCDPLNKCFVFVNNSLNLNDLNVSMRFFFGKLVSIYKFMFVLR